MKLLALPREIGLHPESGLPITASIGRYGPYLAHDGKYAKLRATSEVFDTGMNSAVVKLAEAAAGGGRGTRAPAEPLNVFGPHPVSGGEMKLMAGRYGPYVTDGTTNATLPRGTEPETLTAGSRDRADRRTSRQRPGQRQSQGPEKGTRESACQGRHRG